MRFFYCLLTLFSLFSTQPIFSQPFDFVKVPSPNGLDFNQIYGQVEDEIYLSYFDVNFNQILFSYDGEVLNNVVLPSGFSFGNYFRQIGSKHYVSLNDANFNRSLAILENGVFTVFTAPGNASDLAQFLFQDGDDIYLQYFDVTSFDPVIRIFDGANFSDLNVPAGFEFDLHLGVLNGLRYFLLETGNFEIQLFSFDGSNFVSIPTQSGYQFPNNIFQSDTEIIFSAFDSNFDQKLFKIDANGLIELPPPLGFQNFSAQPFEFEGDNYFGYSDINFDNESLFKYETDGSWTLYNNPAGFIYNGPTSGGILQEIAFIELQNSQSFDVHLASFNGSEINQVFLSPVDQTLNDLFTEYRGGFLLGYYDNYNFDQSLYFFEESNFQLIDPPVAGHTLGNYAGNFLNKAFISFNDNNYDRILYYLALNTLPLSSDSTVSTTVETPYNFQIGDFPFSDADVDDFFQGIQIASLPTKGILHLNGAQVNLEDIISEDDLNTLFYVPLDGGSGSPYDQFQFRVWDGFQVSELSYTMFVNVTGSVGINDLSSATIELFPNPTSGKINLVFNDEFVLQDLRALVTNENGKIVAHQNINSLNTQLSLEHLSSGTYFLLLYNQKHSIVHKLNLVK